MKEEVPDEIVSLIESGLDELSPEKKRALMDQLSRITQNWLKVELEYWEEYADEKKEWDDYRSMQFVFEDVCKAWHNKLAAELGLARPADLKSPKVLHHKS